MKHDRAEQNKEIEMQAEYLDEVSANLKKLAISLRRSQGASFNLPLPGSVDGAARFPEPEAGNYEIEWISTKEAEKIIGCSDDTVRTLCNVGQLEWKRPGKKVIKVNRASAIKYAASRRGPNPSTGSLPSTIVNPVKNADN